MAGNLRTEHPDVGSGGEIARRISALPSLQHNCLHHDYLVREYAVFEKFADGVFSYSAKLAKPDRAIFDLAIRQFGVDPRRTIYLDDLTPNVEAARGAGLRAFRYDPDAHADLTAALRREGVQCV